MSYLDLKEPPKREERLGSCITYGGSICSLAEKRKGCCLSNQERSFSQGSICLMLPALAMLNSIPDSVVLIHGGVGCGSCAHSQNANVRSGGNIRFGRVKDALWASTALSESDIIYGGEKKLQEAIKEIDKKQRPQVIIAVSCCVPGIIGDDVDTITEEIKNEVTAKIIPVHCEGFKTKIWATAYDAVYHGLGRALLENPEEDQRIIPDELEEIQREYRRKKTVNLMNVSSMGRGDEVELSRLLNALGLEVNVYPVFSKPEELYKATEAALSVSTCPTHDDYFLKHLEEKYNIPFILKHMPIGIKNTSLWVHDVAEFFGLEAAAEEIIKLEEAELNKALKPFREFFKGRKVFVSAGEFRALATANLLAELGFEIVAIRSFHDDEFAQGEYEKLANISENDFVVNIANVQPFEEANLIKRTNPEVFLGHWCGNGTASKLGVATHVIYNTGLNYIGYKGVFELARRLYRQLKNPILNKKLSQNTRLPYKEKWYDEEPFKYIKQLEG